jgi:hypothetical protein
LHVRLVKRSNGFLVAPTQLRFLQLGLGVGGCDGFSKPYP